MSFTRRALFIVVLLASGGMAQAAAQEHQQFPLTRTQAGLCDDIKWSTEMLDEHPGLIDACREVVVADGRKWARFEAQFVSVNPDGSVHFSVRNRSDRPGRGRPDAAGAGAGGQNRQQSRALHTPAPFGQHQSLRAGESVRIRYRTGRDAARHGGFGRTCTGGSVLNPFDDVRGRRAAADPVAPHRKSGIVAGPLRDSVPARRPGSHATPIMGVTVQQPDGRRLILRCQGTLHEVRLPRKRRRQHRGIHGAGASSRCCSKARSDARAFERPMMVR